MFFPNPLHGLLRFQEPALGAKIRHCLLFCNSPFFFSDSIYRWMAGLHNLWSKPEYVKISLFNVRIILSWRQLNSKCRKSSLYLPHFCLKAGYKFSFTIRLWTYQPRDKRYCKQTNKPLIFPHVFTFTQFVALWSLKLLSFDLPLLYKSIVLCWRCYISLSSKLPS